MDFVKKIIKSSVLLLFLSGAFVACENDAAEIDALLSKMELGKELATEVEILYSDSAVIQARIIAPEMLIDLDRSKESQEFTKGIKVDFFDGFQNITSTLTGEYAIRYTRDAKVVIRDSVIWESTVGDKLETGELIWDEKKEKIFTNKFVVITRPDEIIHGYGFEADQDFSNARINAVTGRIKVEK